MKTITQNIDRVKDYEISSLMLYSNLNSQPLHCFD